MPSIPDKNLTKGNAEFFSETDVPKKTEVKGTSSRNTSLLDEEAAELLELMGGSFANEEPAIPTTPEKPKTEKLAIEKPEQRATEKLASPPKNKGIPPGSSARANTQYLSSSGATSSLRATSALDSEALELLELMGVNSSSPEAEVETAEKSKEPSPKKPAPTKVARTAIQVSPLKKIYLEETVVSNTSSSSALIKSLIVAVVCIGVIVGYSVYLHYKEKANLPVAVVVQTGNSTDGNNVGYASEDDPIVSIVRLGSSNQPGSNITQALGSTLNGKFGQEWEPHGWQLSTVSGDEQYTVKYIWTANGNQGEAVWQVDAKKRTFVPINDEAKEVTNIKEEIILQQQQQEQEQLQEQQQEQQQQQQLKKFKILPRQVQSD